MRLGLGLGFGFGFGFGFEQLPERPIICTNSSSC